MEIFLSHHSGNDFPFIRNPEYTWTFLLELFFYLLKIIHLREKGIRWIKNVHLGYHKHICRVQPFHKIIFLSNLQILLECLAGTVRSVTAKKGVGERLAQWNHKIKQLENCILLLWIRYALAWICMHIFIFYVYSFEVLQFSLAVRSPSLIQFNTLVSLL